MLTIRCKKCGKTLLEADGKDATIIKVCPKCHASNSIIIKNNQIVSQEVTHNKDWKSSIRYK